MEKMGFSKDVMDHYNTKLRAIEEKKLEERFGDRSKEDVHIPSVARITDVSMYDENGNETKKFLTNKNLLLN